LTADFVRTLEALTTGRELRPIELDGFADLSREAAKELEQRWPAIPPEARTRLIQQVFARSVGDAGPVFDQLALVATGDQDPMVRRLAVASLWESQSRSVANRLLDLLGMEDDDAVLAACCTALGRWVLEREFGSGDRELGDRIVEALRDLAAAAVAAVDVRAAAVTAVAPRDLPWVTALLRESYYDDDRAVRLASVVGMGSSAQAQWLEYLYEQLASDDPEFRRAAATACGEIADEDAVDRLADALDDDDAAVVGAALDALAEIGGDLASEYLGDFRRRVPEELADNLQAALQHMREANAMVDADEEDDW
jgi:HEAT repeat protein